MIRKAVNNADFAEFAAFFVVKSLFGRKFIKIGEMADNDKKRFEKCGNRGTR